MPKKSSSKLGTFVTTVKDYFENLISFLRKHFWLQVTLIIVFLIVFVTFALGTTYAFKHRNDPVVIGVSFSKKYADELGVDWQDNFRALVEDIGFKKFRLMSYWDTHEPENDIYNWETLDWQMDEAANNGAKVDLAVGLRQPRWPECHFPGWAKNLDEENLQNELLEYIEATITRYKDHPALESYQVENEVANRHFGNCPSYDRKFYAREIALIRSLDDNTDVITNASNQSGFPISSPVGDKVGFSVYQRAYFEALGHQYYWSFKFVPPWWHGMRAMAVELLHGSDTFIHELQAEPWGPAPTLDLSIKEQYKTMDPDKFIDITNYAEHTGMKEYYLWGGEWWYWLKTNKNEPAMWNSVKTKVTSTFHS